MSFPTKSKDDNAIGNLPDINELLGGLKGKDVAASERAAALDKFFAGYEILFSAVKNAALGGNLTCKLAILNLLKLHGL